MENKNDDRLINILDDEQLIECVICGTDDLHDYQFECFIEMNTTCDNKKRKQYYVCDSCVMNMIPLIEKRCHRCHLSSDGICDKE